ncbi:MAG: hypothetical protein J7521_13230 [Caulobacter sp.]|nr:hypothetical protein [Caulobacter sp.]
MAGRSEEVAAWSERLQGDIMASMDAQWAGVKDSGDPAVWALAEKKVRALWTFARAAKAVAALTPRPERVASPADEDEAEMHDDHPTDPAELHAALESKIAGITELLERKRRGEGAGDGGPGGDVPRRDALALQRPAD